MIVDVQQAHGSRCEETVEVDDGIDIYRRQCRRECAWQVGGRLYCWQHAHNHWARCLHCDRRIDAATLEDVSADGLMLCRWCRAREVEAVEGRQRVASAVRATAQEAVRAARLAREEFERGLRRAASDGVVGHVYFIEGGGRIKVGHSRRYKDRLATLQTGSPQRLRLLGVIEGTQSDERAIHERFAHLRQHGEWFTDCSELRAYIAEHASLPEAEEAA